MNPSAAAPPFQAFSLLGVYNSSLSSCIFTIFSTKLSTTSNLSLAFVFLFLVFFVVSVSEALTDAGVSERLPVSETKETHSDCSSSNCSSKLTLNRMGGATRFYNNWGACGWLVPQNSIHSIIISPITSSLSRFTVLIFYFSIFESELLYLLLHWSPDFVYPAASISRAIFMKTSLFPVRSQPSPEVPYMEGSNQICNPPTLLYCIVKRFVLKNEF